MGSSGYLCPRDYVLRITKRTKQTLSCAHSTSQTLSGTSFVAPRALSKCACLARDSTAACICATVETLDQSVVLALALLCRPQLKDSASMRVNNSSTCL
jgi:hypothetical protein